MTMFEELGSAVDRGWARTGRAPAALPAIAASALRALPAARIPDPRRTAAAAIADRGLPRQLPVEFGDAQVTVWRNDHLLVQLIYWLDDTTAIHQHGFPGAFRVLEGASLHSVYRFTPDGAREPGIRLGTLHREVQELLEPGGVREIGPGEALIHNLVHVEMPSVTLTVRTPFRAELAPQWLYHPPGVSLDPDFRDAERRSRLRLFAVATRLEPARAPKLARAIIELGLGASWDLLVVLGSRRGTDLAPYEALIARVHRAAGKQLISAFHRLAVRSRLFALRRQVTERAHRVVLALLGDADDRATIVSAIGRLYPGKSPTQLLERWLLQLSGPIGIPLDADSARVLRRALEGLPPDKVASELRARHAAGYTPRAIAQLIAAFAATPLLAPLFVTAAAPAASAPGR